VHEWIKQSASTTTGAVVIDPALLVADPRAVAALLAHEATHAHDDVYGEQADADRRLSAVRGCMVGELRARLAELEVWQQFYGPGGKPQPAHEYEADLNDELARYVAAPRQYAADARKDHRRQCAA
jgi:hypothetical protein